MSASQFMTRTAIALTAAFGIALAGGVTAASAAPLSIAVSGNHFIDGAGNTVRLLGVNRQSTEYACFYRYAFANGTIDEADAKAIAAWHATAVRIPLNEDCWLGRNGLIAAGYRQAIIDYVAALHAHGLYAILDLHWTAPGETPADGQRSLPDDTSAAFWTSVANTFLGDPAVLFDVFNEPYGTGVFPVSWDCWRDGGCRVPTANDQTTPDPAMPTYIAVGMAAMVSAIRATGATQPIMLGGLSYANDLTGWLAHKPSDPRGQLVASFHNYTGEGKCDAQACWDATIAPVAAQVPVVTGEFGEDDCPAAVGDGLRGDNPANFDNTYMAWSDKHGVSYTAWAWIVLDNPTCGGLTSLSLISNYSGSPVDPNGVALHNHLARLAASTGAGGSATTKPPSTGRPPPKASLRILRTLHLSPSTFRPATSGPTVKAATGRGGTRVSYTLSMAARVRFTLERVGHGRRVAARCVRPTSSNRTRTRCARFVGVRGSFTRDRSAGVDRFTFTARVAGHALKPGRYRLVATPATNGLTRAPSRARFRLLR
jgi:endoglucanase